LVFILLAALASPFVHVSGANVQKAGLTLPSSAAQHQAAVKAIFLDSYNTYRALAFGHDEVEPIQKSFTDDLNGWGASIVDAMSTLHIMNMTDLFNEAVEFASNIDFSKSQTPDLVSVFETTIRFVGGLLSAYELSGEQLPILVTKAQQVADKMAFAWVGNNAVPFGHLDFSTNSPNIATSNIAEAGTLTLEWSTLSKFTGNDTYRQLAEKSVRHVASLGTPLPGLPGQGIDPSSGLSVSSYVTWGGGSDSYFEYLIKYPRLNTSLDTVFADTWAKAVDSSIRTLMKNSTVGGHVYLADFDDQRLIRHIGSHLECFHGGNWLFGGQLLGNQTIVNHGLDLIDACWNTYASTLTGIGPESFAFISSDGNFTGGSAATSAELAFYKQHGFYITDGNYIQRPEVLESNFYAWRVTGDTKYLDRAASAINSFNTTLFVAGGYDGLGDVNVGQSSGFIDDTQSFWFAEVLKYLYLTFDDPNNISLDEWVFNTEAHPLKVSPITALPLGSATLETFEKPVQTASGILPAVSQLNKSPKIVPAP